MRMDPDAAREAAGDFRFLETTVLAVFQARHEALALGATEVTPGHLALGILKALPAADRAALLPDPARFTLLCRRLGAGVDAAPAIPEEVGYTAAARAAFGRARAEAGPADIGPLHLLAGVLTEADAFDRDALAAAGLSLEGVRRLQDGGAVP